MAALCPDVIAVMNVCLAIVYYELLILINYTNEKNVYNLVCAITIPSNINS